MLPNGYRKWLCVHLQWLRAPAVPYHPNTCLLFFSHSRRCCTISELSVNTWLDLKPQVHKLLQIRNQKGEAASREAGREASKDYRSWGKMKHYFRFTDEEGKTQWVEVTYLRPHRREKTGMGFTKVCLTSKPQQYQPRHVAPHFYFWAHCWPAPPELPCLPFRS